MMSAMAREARTHRRQIIDAAIGVFLRYGYSRTTMADLSAAAGLSRPTLYLSFPDKDAIFAAVVETMVADKLASIRHGLAAHASLADRLRFACNAWGAEGFELVQAHPDAKDMFDLGFASVCGGYDAFEALLVEILRAPVRAAALDVKAQQLARMMVYSIKGFKDVAKSGADVRRMIGALVAVVAAAIGAPPPNLKENTRHEHARTPRTRRRR
jgi:AcrR family transcriptional regulator